MNKGENRYEEKLLAAVLAALMAMSMTACGSDKEEGGKSEGKNSKDY